MNSHISTEYVNPGSHAHHSPFTAAFTSTQFDLGAAPQPFPAPTLAAAPADTWTSAGSFDPGDWQLFSNDSQLDRETQALLDNILQPHLSIDFPAQGWNDGPGRPF